MTLSEPLVFLAAVGLLAGFIDAIAGGGGLIALPAMSLVVGAGTEAIGTNKIASLAAAGIAFIVYWRRGHVQWRNSLLFTIAVGAGALAGSLVGPHVPVAAFPWLLAATCPVILYVVWNKDLWVARAQHTSEHSWLAVVLSGLVVGFYDGVWGPGGGTFMFLALLFFARLPLLAALAASKLANTAAASVGLVSYGMSGHVHVKEGLLLAAGMLTGGFFGANLASTRASKVVRPTLLFVVVLLAVRVIVEYS